MSAVADIAGYIIDAALLTALASYVARTEHLKKGLGETSNALKNLRLELNLTAKDRKELGLPALPDRSALVAACKRHAWSPSTGHRRECITCGQGQRYVTNPNDYNFMKWTHT